MSDFEISDDEEMARYAMSSQTIEFIWSASRLNRAIAASLDTHAQRKHTTNTFNPSDDTDFQADLQRAIEASKQSMPQAPVKKENTAGVTTPEPSVAPRSDNTASSNDPASDFIRQRAQLEKERLARSQGVVNASFAKTTSGSSHTGKRSRSQSITDDEEEDDDGTPQAKRREPIKIDKGKGKEREDTTELYWNGELRQTANILTDKADVQHKRKVFRMSEIIGEVRVMWILLPSSMF